MQLQADEKPCSLQIIMRGVQEMERNTETWGGIEVLEQDRETWPLSSLGISRICLWWQQARFINVKPAEGGGGEQVDDW